MPAVEPNLDVPSADEISLPRQPRAVTSPHSISWSHATIERSFGLHGALRRTTRMLKMSCRIPEGFPRPWPVPGKGAVRHLAVPHYCERVSDETAPAAWDPGDFFRWPGLNTRCGDSDAICS